MERNAGTTIFGRLELIREEASSVGVQVFGPTWAVLDSETGELARACFLDAELLPDAASRDAFVAGLEDLTSLRDPTLVPQIYAGADPHGGAVVYEALAGGVSFDDLYDGTGSFDLSAEVGRLARQLARALASLHARGQVHGLLTSACVFVGSRGPAVYQFGLAPLCDRTVLLRRVRAFGLPNLAPEVVAGGPFTPVADLYAWAVTVAQFAAAARGAEAIAAARGGQELPGLSPALRSAVQACLSDDPAARPRDGGELLRLIELAGLGEGSGALRPEDPAPVPEDSSPEAEPAAPPVPEASPEVVPASEPAAEVASEPAPTSSAAEPAPAPSTPTAPSTPIAEPTPEPSRAAASEPTKPIPTSIPTPTGPPIAAPIAAPAATPSVPTVTAPTASPMTPTLPTSGRPFVPPSPPIVPTIPTLPSGTSGTRPMPPPPTLRPSAAAAKGPPTIAPGASASLPITSFEEMLTTGDRQRRPATIPPPSSTPAPAPAPPGASGSSVRAVIELSPEDMLSESGQWKPGGQPSNKSASNLRRVRVLTDPINREGSGLINLGRAPLAEDLANVPEAPAQRRTGEVIIGGTREELDAASKATTLRLDPMNAAAAVQAATEAAAAAASSQSAQAARAADSSLTSLSSEGKATDGSSSSLSGASASQAEAAPEVSRPGGSVPAASDQAGTPSISSSSRRRSSAVSSSASGSGEPRDWGTIPPIADLVPTAPTALETARPNLPATQALPNKLVPILVIVAIALIVLIFVAR